MLLSKIGSGRPRAGIGAPRVGWDRRLSKGDGAFDAGGAMRDGPLHRVGGGQTERQTEGALEGGDQRRDEDAPHGVSPFAEGFVRPERKQPFSVGGVDETCPLSRTTPRRR